MIWKGKGPHAVASDQGYVVARFRTGDTQQFRPSLRGSFIGGTYKTADEAKRACIDHHKEASCQVQS